MVHGKKRIPYWIDWRLPGLAGPEYHAVISFGLPIEPEDSQYGEYRSTARVAARDQASTHDNHCALISGYSGRLCY